MWLAKRHWFWRMLYLGTSGYKEYCHYFFLLHTYLDLDILNAFSSIAFWSRNSILVDPSFHYIGMKERLILHLAWLKFTEKSACGIVFNLINVFTKNIKTVEHTEGIQLVCFCRRVFYKNELLFTKSFLQLLSRPSALYQVERFW